MKNKLRMYKMKMAFKTMVKLIKTSLKRNRSKAMDLSNKKRVKMSYMRTIRCKS